MGYKQKKIVILATDYSWQSSILVMAALRILISMYNDSEIMVFISGTNKMREEKFRVLRLLGKYLTHHPNIKFWMLFNKPFTRPISQEIDKFGVENSSMSAHSINDEKFVNSLNLSDDASLIILGWPAKLSAKVLRKFHTSINFHDGELPNYRGTYATQWSIYNREVESGFTFHEVEEELDAGHALATGSVPIWENDDLIDVEFRKIKKAQEVLSSVLNFLGRRKLPIRFQPNVSISTLYTKKMAMDLYCIRDISTLTSQDLRLRIKSFGVVKILTASGEVWITKKHIISESPLTLFGLYHVFELSDKTYLKVSRLDLLNTIRRMWMKNV